MPKWPISTTRWNLVALQETDDALRQVLAAEGRARKGKLSCFVKDAVRIVEAEAAKRANAGRTGVEIADAVAKALEWARRR